MAANLDASMADLINLSALNSHARQVTWQECRELMKLCDIAIEALYELGADRLALEIAERKHAALNRIEASLCPPPREAQN